MPEFRDATLFMTAYAFGLRRNETRTLGTVAFVFNVAGAELANMGSVGSGSASRQRGRQDGVARRLPALNSRFVSDRTEFGLDNGLDFHSSGGLLRMHLTEGDLNPQFVQEHLRHEHPATTWNHTCVSSDFHRRNIRYHIEATVPRR